MKQKNVLFSFIATIMIVNCYATETSSDPLSGLAERQSMHEEVVSQRDALAIRVEQLVAALENQAPPPAAFTPQGSAPSTGDTQASAMAAMDLLRTTPPRNLDAEIAAATLSLTEQISTLEAQVARLQEQAREPSEDHGADEQISRLQSERQRMESQHADALASLRTELQRSSAAANQRLQGLLCQEQETTQTLRSQLAECDATIDRRDADLAQHVRDLAARAATIAERDVTIAQLQAELLVAQGVPPVHRPAAPALGPRVQAKNSANRY